jgi:hypothetical protein
MKVIPETTLFIMSVSDEGYSRNYSVYYEHRVDSGITFIRYAHNKQSSFWNNLQQVRS